MELREALRNYIVCNLSPTRRQRGWLCTATRSVTVCTCDRRTRHQSRGVRTVRAIGRARDLPLARRLGTNA
jgi:hypothetical protein